ncbi:SH3 domain-containing protein [Nodosilinea sp. LEGE 06152]|uniref:SH3 domain-containing protein n=1 Tax=Nodosilinea sp. LEGE 06152 TaxID=2777966 RepID=UPI0018818D48|nr:SH3 domain-containing protein [Nodosilinea sp. LEGE 06152]MBE9159517.1 SH3 domain-containing protein [Nodosilinea sp. LEGE 06152]
MKSSMLLCLGVLLLALGGCDRSANTNAPAEATLPSEGSEDTAGSNDALGETVEDGGFRSTPINPARTAQLVTQGEGSQVNLRSQPTTQSSAQGYGLGGDQITLLRLAEGEGGFSWYYVKFAQSEAEGWVRGDFIDTTGQVASAAPAPGSGVGTGSEISTGPCGDGSRPEAFFETKSFAIHLCQTPQGLSYIGIDKTNNETLATADVRQDQGTYIAINGNYQYHVSDDNLAVYQVTSGSYSQLENEDVIRHERFMY